MQGMKVHRCGVLELALDGRGDHQDSDRDCQVVADFTGPSGRIVSIRAFWDRGRTWRLRFSPDDNRDWVAVCGNEWDQSPT